MPSLFYNIIAMDRIQFTDCEPIFLVGTGRSGTTLLQLLLNAHPRIAVWGEIHYFDQILQIKKWVPTISRLEDLKRFFAFVKRTEHYQHLPYAENVFKSVNKRLIAENNRTYEKFYRIALEEYAKSQGKLRFGDKTPYNILYLEEISQLFPKCKIIHIKRDPRDVVASYIKLPAASKDVIIHSLAWKCFITSWKNYLAIKPVTNNYLELAYEDLVGNPKQELKRICEFIGESYNREMLHFHKTSDRYIKNEPWKVGVLRPINRNSIGNGTRELTATKIFITEKLTGALLSSSGYRRTQSQLKTKLLSPIVFFGEIAKYISHRYIRTKSHGQADDGIIRSNRSKFYSILFKSILKLTCY
jgi:hypothetical protein